MPGLWAGLRSGQPAPKRSGRLPKDGCPAGLCRRAYVPSLLLLLLALASLRGALAVAATTGRFTKGAWGLDIVYDVRLASFRRRCRLSTPAHAGCRKNCIFVYSGLPLCFILHDVFGAKLLHPCARMAVAGASLRAGGPPRFPGPIHGRPGPRGSAHERRYAEGQGALL